MADTVITITVSDADLATVTPSALTAVVATGSSYMVSFLPVQGYRVNVASSDGWTSGPTAGMVTKTFTPTDPTLSINVVADPIPIPVETVSLVALTRLYVGEAIPTGGHDTDTFFTDGVIGGMVMEAGGNVLRAASQLWRMKAAEYARLIDLDEGGSVRKLTQRYRQATELVTEFEQAAQRYDDAVTGAVRTTARPVNIRGLRADGWRSPGAFRDSGFLVLEQQFTLTGLPPLGPFDPVYAPFTDNA